MRRLNNRLASKRCRENFAASFKAQDKEGQREILQVPKSRLARHSLGGLSKNLNLVDVTTAQATRLDL